MSSSLSMHGFYKGQCGRAIIETGKHSQAKPAWLVQVAQEPQPWDCYLRTSSVSPTSSKGRAMFLSLSSSPSLLLPSNVLPFQEVSRGGHSLSLSASLGEGPREKFKESLAPELASF